VSNKITLTLTADIDWEYPVDSSRGGRKDDLSKLVLLMKEMKESFSKQSSTLGISMALPSDYEYLRHFDVKAMEPFVDWFGLMVKPMVKQYIKTDGFRHTISQVQIIRNKTASFAHTLTWR
jgi:Glycosyl hydrolases family 18